MALTVEEMRTSLDRIFAIQSIHTDDRAAYLQTIYEGCSWMTASHFDEAVKDICKTLKSKPRPTVPTFLAKFHEMAKTYGWNAVRPRCAKCNNVGLVEIRLRRKETGEVSYAMTPCNVCKTVLVEARPDDRFEIVRDPQEEPYGG